MTRNMIEANARIFAHLEGYCTKRGEPVQTPGLQRFIMSADSQDRNFLKNARLLSKRVLRFGHHRALVHMKSGPAEFIGLLGFDLDFDLGSPMVGLEPVELRAGMVATMLSELLPLPSAGAAQVRNIVEVGSRSDDNYRGHTSLALESLFPRIQVVQSVDELDDDSIARIYLMICAYECDQGASWVDTELAQALIALTALAVPRLPYFGICRSMLDPDPRSLFMALYRCIEATYAYESARKVIQDLGLGVDWHDLAASLERELSWRPKEASSLNVILRYSVEDDLRRICELLGDAAGEDVQASAGRAIYKLRNSIVHYRPGLESGMVDPEVDWNELCAVLVSVVFDVFSEAYRS